MSVEGKIYSPFLRQIVIGIIAAAIFTSLAFAAAAPLKDFGGFKDPALFTRMPNYFLAYSSSFVEKQFDAYEFRVTEGGKAVKKRLEGHFTQYCYTFDPVSGAQMPSSLQIIRNYQNAAAKIGGQVLYDSSATTIRITKKDQEIWVEVDPVNSGKGYYLRIVERQAMQQQIIANADALQAGLAETGHVEVPGIFFDTGKAEIKPESGPALQEVAKMLKANPNIKVWVVGHTDYVGVADANVVLANARATAVVKALTQQYGIDAKRLSPYGVGPYAPVASNATEEGRAKNRRVELVVQP